MSPIKIDASCRYAQNHEWIRLEGDLAVVGISDYAQDQLGDIVYVELPQVGDQLAQAESFGVVESVKAASDCYLPVAGEITGVNEHLESEPELVNSDPFGDGWFVRIKIADPAQLDSLMDAAAYATFCEQDS